MEREILFTDGFYLNKVHEKAPAFIVASVSIHRDKAIAWLQNNPGLVDEKGYIKLTGKESKEGKRYFQVDTWKPEPKQNALPTKESDEQEAPPITEEDVPW